MRGRPRVNRARAFCGAVLAVMLFGEFATHATVAVRPPPFKVTSSVIDRFGKMEEATIVFENEKPFLKCRCFALAQLNSPRRPLFTRESSGPTRESRGQAGKDA